MKLGGVRESGNVDDRRGSGGKVALSGGAVVVVVIVGALMGKGPLEILGDVLGEGGGVSDGAPADPNDPSKVFVGKVLTTTEAAWEEQFAKLGKRYTPPTLVLFRDSVSSACGHQSAAVGPFYCPPDHKAYLDLTFFDDLARQLGAPGDFAAAYVVAHEIGHHVQNLIPSDERGHKEKGERGASVRTELQADCYAGVWGAYARKNDILDIGDIDEALKAAQAIGDDTLQKRGGGKVRPESFSHGTSEQRARWFKRGMDAGDAKACDTFASSAL